VTTISRSRISEQAGTSLGDLLSLVPGIFVKDYGGTSGLKTISQRGFGAEHTLVLLNGMRISSLQNGLLDLGVFPIREMDAVEVIGGGNSAAFGSEAVGGAVNIVMGSQTFPGTINLESSLGSFGYQRFSFRAGHSGADGWIRGGYFSERSTEAFPFSFSNGPASQEVLRKNADFSSRYANLSSFYAPGNGVALSSFFQAFESDRGVGGPVVSPSSSSQARQTDQDYLLQVAVRADSSAGGWSVTAQAHVMYQRYTDPGVKIGSSDGLDTYFKNYDYRAVPSWNTRAGEDLRLNAGVELGSTRGAGSSLAEEVVRLQAAPFLAAEWLAIRGPGVVSTLSVFPSFRLDTYSGFQPTWSPQVAAVMRFARIPGAAQVEPLLRATASRNFRIPTFNELYYSGGGGAGNPALRPERATGFEAGGGVTASLFGRHDVSAAWFTNSMTDRIVWTPAGAASVAPKNIRSVDTDGIETSWGWSLPGEFIRVDVNYTFVRSIKQSRDHEADPNVGTQIIYVPRESGSIRIGWDAPLDHMQTSRVGAVVTLNIVGFRYTTEDNREVLPGYTVAALALTGSAAIAPLILTGKLELQNLFDEQYQVMTGYPMPGRSLRFTLGVEM
jgi:outer membrane cobalamin receptor